MTRAPIRSRRPPPARTARAAAEPAARRPSLRELEVLRALIATRKTTSAAQRLGISQPAVSRAIAGLERRTGRALFRREGGRLVPTADALLLYEQVAPIFATLERLERAPWATGGGAPLRLAAPATLAHAFLPKLVAAFAREAGGLPVQVEIGTTMDVIASVADGNVDLGITDTGAPHASVKLEPFRRSSAHLVLGVDHPLAARAAIGPADLDGVDLIVLTRRFAVRTIFDRLMMDAGAEPTIVFEVATAAMAYELVRAGVGVALLNPFPLAFTADPGVVFRPFEPAVAFQTSFVVSAAVPLPPVARRFMEFVRTRQPDDGLSLPLR